MNEKPGTFLAGMLAMLAIVLGLWFAHLLVNVFAPATTPAAPPSATPASTVTASPTLPPPVKGFRLAGVAVNADQLYAVIEKPDGSHGLYRRNDEVEGLGRLLRVGGDEIVVSTPSGDLTLWVAPASTPTPTVTRRPATPTMVRRTPPATAPAGGSAPAATPSAAPGPPAS